MANEEIEQEKEQMPLDERIQKMRMNWTEISWIKIQKSGSETSWIKKH